MVTELCSRVRRGDEFCAGCAWERYVKPLTTPWVGFERGYPPRNAKDPDPTALRVRFVSAAEILANPGPPRVVAETDTEEWLRSMEAYDAFVDALLARLDDAERRGSGSACCGGWPVP